MGKVKNVLIFLSLLLISGCAFIIPQAGPSTQAIKEADSEYLTLIDLTPRLVGAFSASKPSYIDIMKELKTERYSPRIDRGDVLEVVIYETPPAVLFASQSPLAVSAGPVAFAVPPQIVDDEGFITVPFVGRVYVRGKTPEQVGRFIEDSLRGKANKPQAVVSIRGFHSSYVTVMGHVRENRSVPLTYNIATLLDVLGAVGGPTSPINKTVIKITRGSKEVLVPLEEVIKNPQLNINLQPGDIITVIYQNQYITVLGATGKNAEIDFEAMGINLAQALARAGGLRDEIAHAKGVFVFRFEDKEILDRLNIPYKAYTKDGKVPVVYNIDLSKGESVLLLREFPVRDKDIIYVSTAPAAQLKKFTSIISDIVQPILLIRALTR
ncbi:polysaccharide biosynthesis/export family protein [Thermocrinis sp.]